MEAKGYRQLWGSQLTPDPAGVTLAPGRRADLCDLTFDNPLCLGWTYNGPGGLVLEVLSGCGRNSSTISRLSLDGSTGLALCERFRLAVINQTGAAIMLPIAGAAGLVTTPPTAPGDPLATVFAAAGLVPSRWRQWLNIANTSGGSITIKVGRNSRLYANLANGQSLRIDDLRDSVAVSGACTVLEAP